MPTVVPFHRAVVADPAFAPEDGSPFRVHTRWIETEFDNTIRPFEAEPQAAPEAEERQAIVVEVAGKRLEVVLPALPGAPKANGTAGKPRKSRAARGGTKAAAGGDGLTSPMQGTIVKIAVDNGDEVAEGDLVVVLEAMKMEQPLTAHKAGTVSGLTVSPGDTVSAGTVLATIS
jgi:acetyl-CoA/propionyl-CoA carboxylase biotin carboxyl carrier protein